MNRKTCIPSPELALQLDPYSPASAMKNSGRAVWTKRTMPTVGMVSTTSECPVNFQILRNHAARMSRALAESFRMRLGNLCVAPCKFRRMRTDPNLQNLIRCDRLREPQWASSSNLSRSSATLPVLNLYFSLHPFADIGSAILSFTPSASQTY